jgi:hypothetical protein
MNTDQENNKVDQKDQQQKQRKPTSKEFVKYSFNGNELKDLSDNLARAVTDRARKEDEKKAAVTSMNADIEAETTKINALAEKIQNGWEMRYIDCYVEKDYKAKKVSYTRIDNNEIVKTRPMSPEEFQMSLDEQREQNKKNNKKDKGGKQK